MPQSYSKKQFLPFLLILWLTALACAVVRPDTRPASGELAIRTRLPTLTRTPLPTLTPTAVSTPVAMVQEADSPAVQPEQSSANAAAADSNGSMTEDTNASTDGASAIAAGAETEGENPELEQASAPAEASAAEGSVGSNELPGASAADTSSAQEQAVAANTPVSVPTATATETLTPTIPPTATSTEVPTATSTPTPTPLPQDWLISGVHLHQAETNVLLYGNVTNNTGGGQEISTISATVYDAQGQPLTLAEAPDPYWPGYVVLPGDTIPFELALEATGVTTFDLMVVAKPSDDPTRQDFEFSDLEARNDDEDYCVSGTLDNPGAEIREYLIIAAILYDDQDRVINFDDYGIFGYVGLSSGDSVPFDLCVQPPNQGVARYEVRAWGL